MNTTVAAGPRPMAMLNRIVEPAVRMGLAAPLPIPVGWWSGLIVMEIPGRRSARIYRVPALALAHRDLLLVSTVRGESQWMRNLAAATDIEVWLRGRCRPARSFVWGDVDPRSVTALRERIAFRNLGIWCDALGARGALLTLG